VSKTRQIEAAVQGKMKEMMVLKVMVGELGAFIHDEIRWSGCVVVVNHKFIVIQRSSGDHLCKNLTPGQCPPAEAKKKNTYRIVPRRRFGQSCIILSQFHPFPNDDLVQQQRLPTGSDTLVGRVVVGPNR